MCCQLPVATFSEYPPIAAVAKFPFVCWLVVSFLDAGCRTESPKCGFSTRDAAQENYIVLMTQMNKKCEEYNFEQETKRVHFKLVVKNVPYSPSAPGFGNTPHTTEAFGLEYNWMTAFRGPLTLARNRV